jgi:hypothetical protein
LQNCPDGFNQYVTAAEEKTDASFLTSDCQPSAEYKHPSIRTCGLASEYPLANVSREHWRCIAHNDFPYRSGASLCATAPPAPIVSIGVYYYSDSSCGAVSEFFLAIFECFFGFVPIFVLLSVGRHELILSRLRLDGVEVTGRCTAMSANRYKSGKNSRIKRLLTVKFSANEDGTQTCTKVFELKGMKTVFDAHAVSG